MPSALPDCLRCKTRMVAGYLLENGDYNSRTVTQWVEGSPEKSFWTGLALRDRDVLQVATYRCPNCGYLELYANIVPEKLR